MRNIALRARDFPALAATLIGSMLASTANAVPVGITGIAPGQSSYFLLAETDTIDFTQNAMFDLTNVGESRILYTGLQVSPVSR